MTLAEFKAWFEGFTDGITDAPTPEQWAKIKEKVDLLEKFDLIRDARPIQGGMIDRFPNYVVGGMQGATAGQIGVLVKPDPDHKIRA